MRLETEAVFNSVKDRFGKTWGYGGFSDRNAVGGGGAKSYHAYGQAFDISGSAATMQKIAEYLRMNAPGDFSVIYNNKIARPGEAWRKYGGKGTGKDPHTSHVHIEFRSYGGQKKSNVPLGKQRDIYGQPPQAPKSSYTNNYKTKREALKSPGYKAYKGHLSAALKTGKVPQSWIVPLTELIGRESSWNPGVKNGKSTAYGYAQFLSDTRSQYEKKMKMSYSNPVNQIIMMVQYIKDRYRTPEEALKHWDRKNWY